MKRIFLIPSLVAAGLFAGKAAALPAAAPDAGAKKKFSLFELFKLDHKYTLAAHSSHASHGSHASHASHSSGGYYVPPVPAPLYVPPAVSQPPTAPAPLLKLPGNSAKFEAIVQQVQLALYTYGYYTGPITGIVDPHTGAAIARMQTDYGIKITGTITPQVLDALGIVAQ